MKSARGYTLVELMVALGVFAIIMLLASGAYLMMINVTRKAQGMSTGVNNLAFALEVMTRNMRTGTNYSCNFAGDCAAVGGNTFSFDGNVNGVIVPITYSLVGNSIQEVKGAQTRFLTDATVNITSLKFYVVGTQKTPTNYQQPHVLMVVSGTVTSSALNTDPFYIQTGSTMRGTDI